jgi:hypothetical protein
MAKLTAAKRKRIPSSEFAGPDRSYPIEDHNHAANAKSRASEEYAKGNLSQSEYKTIIRRANVKLGKKP